METSDIKEHMALTDELHKIHGESIRYLTDILGNLESRIDEIEEYLEENTKENKNEL